MRNMHASLAILASLALTDAQSTSGALGYTCHPYCVNTTIPPSNTNLTFGRHYAILNGDLANLLAPIANTSAGSAFINSTATWIDFVHAQNPVPLTFFTRPAFSNSRKPEISATTPYTKAASLLGGPNDPITQIYPAFHVDEEKGDIVLFKGRYYAGWGNELETILRAQGIDTVILSGVTTSGVVLNTVYTLFNLDYKVYVIANNTIQLGDNAPEVYKWTLEGIIPGLPADVISVEQAMAAVKRSGKAVY